MGQGFEAEREGGEGVSPLGSVLRVTWLNSHTQTSVLLKGAPLGLHFLPFALDSYATEGDLWFGVASAPGQDKLTNAS